MARLLCPSCGRTFAYAGGGEATCPHCSYSSKVAGGAPLGPTGMGMYAPAPEGRPPPLPGEPTVPTGTSGYAVASLVLGILSVLGGFFLLVPPILSLVFGIVGLRETRSKERTGHGLAVAGLVLSGLVMLGYLFFLTSFILFEVIGL